VSPRNIAASVRQRLFNLAGERGEDFGLMLTRYGLERLLYRLSRSTQGDGFVLKGAMLFALWSDQPHRPTRDLDLLGRGSPDIKRLEEAFREIIRLDVEDDGLEFRAESVRGERIRADQEYEGVRVNLEALLGAARIHLQVDVAFGDVVTPAPEEIDYPVLLDYPVPRLRAYPRETVVAEKFEAMVRLGMTNSRMKDFYDLWVMSRDFEFDGQTLCRAIAATFDRRESLLPKETPLALTREFSSDQAKATQWAAFLRRLNPEYGDMPLTRVTDELRGFLMPMAVVAAKDEATEMSWQPRGPWR
jgi:predicted nucleotidyltransferase component of viral defense system